MSRQLIEVTDISRLARPVGNNIDVGRVAVYIAESEVAEIKPAIGDALYLSLLDAIGEEAIPQAYLLLLEGGEYEAADGQRRAFCGLRTALAYYAYAKLVRNNSINITRMGVVLKNDEHSSHMDARAIRELHDDARAYADRCLMEAVAFLNERSAEYPGFESQQTVPKLRKMTISAVGD